MAFPSWVDVTESSETGYTTTHVYDLPATVAANDRLWLVAAGGHESFAPTGGTLAGWDEALDVTLNPFYRWRIYTRVADGTEDGTTVSFTTSSGVRSSAQVVRVSGAHIGGDGTGWELVASTVAYGTAPNPPALTAPWGSADNLWLALLTCGSNGTTVTGNPTNYTAGADGDAAAQYVVGSAYRAIATDTQDPAAFTIGTAENWCAATLIIRPNTGVEATPARAVARADAVSAPFASVPVAATPERAVARARPSSVVGYPYTPPGLQFPAATLGVRVEVAWGADLTAPNTWQWTDLTDRLVGEPSELVIQLTAGRAPESADTQPTTVGLTLDNSDGALTPGNPASPWWPNVERGAPLRVWVEGATPALYIPGQTNAYAYTPDHPDLAVTDLDVRVLVDPERWAAAARYTSTSLQNLTDLQRLVSRDDGGRIGGTARGWMLSTSDIGRPLAQWSNGTTHLDYEGAPTVASLRPSWLGMTITPDDGAGGHTTVLWRWDEGGTPPADIAEWELVDAWAGTGATTLATAGGNPVCLGYRGPDAAPSFRGRILRAEIRSGVNGPIVADPDFTVASVGAPVVLDSTGKPWALAGAAEITRHRVRFTGQIAELAIEWPYADHAAGIGIDDPDGRHPTECRAVITAAGPLRRLTQGEPSLRSALYRAVTSATALDNVTAYWPMEDGAQAAHFASGLTGGPAMTYTGFRPATKTDLVSSAPLPTTAKTGDPVTWSAPVAGGTTTRWAVEWFAHIDDLETSPAVTELMRVDATGGVTHLRAEISTGDLILQAWNGATLLGTLNLGGGANYVDTWLLLRIEARQNGANIDWTFGYVDLGTGGGATASGTLGARTLGPVTGVSGATVGPPGSGYTLGHLIVHDGTLATGWLAGADTAWVGESAAHRFWRLCAEEGIPVEIIGDPTAYTTLRGDLTRSQAMGPQRLKPLTDLLRECVVCDMGALIERRGAPGLIYRTRGAIENQDPILPLNAADNEIAGKLAPILDDGRLRNDITVTSAGGASARAVDQGSVDRHGRYDDSVEIVGVGGLAVQSDILTAQPGLADAVDQQNEQQAEWRLQLATATAVRYPNLTVDLGIAPHLIDTWLATHVGDRVTVTGLPVQQAGDQVELLVDQIGERLTPTGWIVQLACSPGDGWLTGELEP